MNDPVLVLAVIVFTVSLALIMVREWGRVQAAPPPSQQFQTLAASPAPVDGRLEREIDKLREEQVRLRIEIDRLKRPMGPSTGD